MSTENDLLIMSAARLYSLGIDLEGARERLRKLVADGIPYESPEMLAALTDFQTLETQWKAMEKEHIEYQYELLKRKIKGK